MRRGLLVVGAIGMVGVGAMLFASRSLVTTVAGVEEARELESAFNVALGGSLAPGTVTTVRRMPLGEGRGWVWLVDASLAPGVRPGDPAVELHLRRLVPRALARGVAPRWGLAGTVPAGVRVRLAVAGGPTADLRFDALARQVADFPPAGGGTRPKETPR